MRGVIKLFNFGFIIFCSMSFYGCATVIHGTSQVIPILTKPEGAIVRSDTGLECTTPCKLKLKRKYDHAIKIYKEGYEEQSVIVQHVTSGAVAGNLILGGLIGWGVDASFGGQYRLIPELINIDLKPIKVPEKTGSLINKLKELEELRKAEAVTDEEYKKLKENLLEEFKTK